MMIIDLQNKGDRLDTLQGDYTVVSAVYDESNLFFKYIHILMEPITSGSFIIKNKDFEVTVIFDKSEDPRFNLFSFDVYFLRFRESNPLIVRITNELTSKYFTYREFDDFFASGLVNLWDIKDYSKGTSILEELYSESLRVNKKIIYRLEKKEPYQGVDVSRNESDIVSESYTHRPLEYFEHYETYVSFDNKKLNIFFDDSVNSGPISNIQDLVYTKIIVDYIWDGDVLQRIQFDYIGNTYTYNRDRQGRLKYYSTSLLVSKQNKDYNIIEKMEGNEKDFQQVGQKDGQEDQNTASNEDQSNEESHFVQPLTPSLEDYYRRFGTPSMEEYQNGEHQTENEEAHDIEKRGDHKETREIRKFSKTKSFTRRFTSKLIGNNHRFSELIQDDKDVNLEDFTSSSGLQVKSMYETYTKEVMTKNDHHSELAELLSGFAIGVLITIPMCAYPVYLGYKRYMRQ